MPEGRLLLGSLGCLTVAAALAVAAVGAHDLARARPTAAAGAQLGVTGVRATAHGAPQRVAATLAGVRDDTRYAAALAAVAAVPHVRTRSDLVHRGGSAIAAIEAARRQERDPRRRAQLDDLRGALTLITAAGRRQREGRQALDEAIGLLQAAVRADPAGEQAKFNLELALTLAALRPPPPVVGGGTGGRRQGGRSGPAPRQGSGSASAAPPGMGY